MRYPSRAIFLPALAVAVLAGFGVDTVASADRDQAAQLRFCLRVAGVAVGVLIAALLVLALCTLDFSVKAPRVVTDDKAWPNLPEILRHPVPFVSLGLSLAVFVLACRSPCRAALLAASLISVLVLEQGFYAAATFQTLPPDAPRSESPVVDYLSPRAKGWRAFGRQFTLADREATYHHVHKVQSYDTLALARMLDYVDAARIDPGDPLNALMGYPQLDLSRMSENLFDLLGARYVLAQLRDRVPGGKSGWRLVTQGDIDVPVHARGSSPGRMGCRIWENDSALPRGFVVGEVRTARPGETIADALRAHDPHREVVLDRDVLPPGPARPSLPHTSSTIRPTGSSWKRRLTTPDTWY